MIMGSLTKYLRDKKKEYHKAEWVKFRDYLVKYKRMERTGKMLGEI